MAMVFGFWLLNNYNNFGNKSRGNMEWKQKFIQNIYVLLFTFYLYEACSTYFEIRPSLELQNIYHGEMFKVLLLLQVYSLVVSPCILRLPKTYHMSRKSNHTHTRFHPMKVVLLTSTTSTTTTSETTNTTEEIDIGDNFVGKCKISYFSLF